MDIIQELKIAEREAEERLKIAKQEASMRVLHTKQELQHDYNMKKTAMYDALEVFQNEQNKASEGVIDAKIKVLEEKHKAMQHDNNLENRLADEMYKYCISLFKA